MNKLFQSLLDIDDIDEENTISEETAAEIIILNNEIINIGCGAELGIAESILKCIKKNKLIIKSNVLSNIRNDDKLRIRSIKVYDEITTKLLSLGIIKSYKNSSVNFIRQYFFNISLKLDFYKFF